jgi:hypothetical protein
MRQILFLAGAGLLLAGCSDNPSPDEQAMADERDIAMVEQANKAMPPLHMVTPEPILLPDIERYDLLGETCSYAPGTSLGARVIAREADAFMKIDGDIERFAADPVPVSCRCGPARSTTARAIQWCSRFAKRARNLRRRRPRRRAQSRATTKARSPCATATGGWFTRVPASRSAAGSVSARA